MAESLPTGSAVVDTVANAKPEKKTFAGSNEKKTVTHADDTFFKMYISPIQLKHSSIEKNYIFAKNK